MTLPSPPPPSPYIVHMLVVAFIALGSVLSPRPGDYRKGEYMATLGNEVRSRLLGKLLVPRYMLVYDGTTTGTVRVFSEV